MIWTILQSDPQKPDVWSLQDVSSRYNYDLHIYNDIWQVTRYVERLVTGGGGILSSPAVHGNTVYFTTLDGYLYALQNGTTTSSAQRVQEKFQKSAVKVFPNPSKGTTNIMYNMETPAKVKVSIFDNTGKLLKVLMDKEMPAGSHSLKWNAPKSDKDSASGVYHCRVKIGKYTQNKKIVLQ